MRVNRNNDGQPNKCTFLQDVIDAEIEGPTLLWLCSAWILQACNMGQAQLWK